MIRYLIPLFIVFGLTKQSTKRVIMLFSDDASAKQLQLQQQLLAADKKGCDDREIVVQYYTPKDADVYKKNNVISGFTFVLIGKDGGEKLRSHTPVTTKKLFALIDAMPMRKEVITHSGGYGR